MNSEIIQVSYELIEKPKKLEINKNDDLKSIKNVNLKDKEKVIC